MEIDKWTFAGLKFDVQREHKLTAMTRLQCPDWCIDYDDVFDDRLKTIGYLTAITLASEVYGGLHATAFWATFPSSIEKLLWQMSSLMITAFGAALTLCVLMIHLINRLIDLLERDAMPYHAAIKLSNWTLDLAVSASLLFYLFCRTFRCRGILH